MAFPEGSFCSCYTYMLISHMGAAFHQKTSPCMHVHYVHYKCRKRTHHGHLYNLTIYYNSIVMQWPAVVLKISYYPTHTQWIAFNCI